MVLGTAVTAHNLTLSGAQYEILLTAANAAGPGPAQQVSVLAEQHAGTCPAGRTELPAASRELFSTQWDAGCPLHSPFHPRFRLQGRQRGRQHRDGAVGSTKLWLSLLLRAAAAAGSHGTGRLHPTGFPCQEHPRGERQGSSTQSPPPVPPPTRGWILVGV